MSIPYCVYVVHHRFHIHVQALQNCENLPVHMFISVHSLPFFSLLLVFSFSLIQIPQTARLLQRQNYRENHHFTMESFSQKHKAKKSLWKQSITQIQNASKSEDGKDEPKAFVMRRSGKQERKKHADFSPKRLIRTHGRVCAACCYQFPSSWALCL